MHQNLRRLIEGYKKKMMMDLCTVKLLTVDQAPGAKVKQNWLFEYLRSIG